MLETVPIQTLGFAHFIAQSDAVGKTVLALLLLMSVLSWVIILVKSFFGVQRSRRSKAFLKLFWNAPSLDAVVETLAQQKFSCPFSRLTLHAVEAKRRHEHVGSHYENAGAAQTFIANAGSQQEVLTRAMRNLLDEETARCETGLTVLATVGSTAPFIGLFGTVWGVYHALVAIGMSGAGTLDKVAGPVGEALIMTGLGLAVAIPAVIAYNWLTRANRVLLARLDAFAYELFTALTMQPPRN